MIVVKVGGSLYDSPSLGPVLRAFIASLAPAQVLLVPGGGAVADAVRAFDRTHGLGEEAAHWVALRALSVTAAFLERIVGADVLTSPLEGEGAAFGSANAAGGGDRFTRDVPPPPPATGTKPPVATSPSGGEVKTHTARVLDCYAFALEDEGRPGALPHTWSVTTDSIAARAALVFGAERLILLKSVSVPPGTPWAEAAARGWVDAHFPQVAAFLTRPVEIINFRAKLDAHA